MENITFDKIIIAGMEYLKLINVEINKRMNDHSNAIITCEVSNEQAEAMSVALEDGEYIIISAEDDREYEVLFIGVKYDVVIEKQAAYNLAKMEIKSTSYLLDKEIKSRTFQNTHIRYSEAINEIIADKAHISFNVTDKFLMTFWMQYEETDWKMLLRLASGCGACVVANVNTRIPIIDIGIPIDKTDSRSIGGKLLNDQMVVQSFVLGTNSFFDKGVLETKLITGNQASFDTEIIVNRNIEGMMFTGIVQNVDREKVQVFFDEIDSDYDSNSDTWFEYAAAYAGEGGRYGSGFYFMPEIGDRVRVFFPEGDSGEGFAFATETTYVTDDISKYSWRAPGGQELLFTKDGIRISCNNNSIYIDLRGDDGDTGIQISCDTDVCMETHPNPNQEYSIINIVGKESVIMKADNQILMETAEASIEIDKDKIIMNAETVYIQ